MAYYISLFITLHTSCVKVYIPAPFYNLLSFLFKITIPDTMYKEKQYFSFTYIFESFWEAHNDEEKTNNDLQTKQIKHQSIILTLGQKYEL